MTDLPPVAAAVCNECPWRRQHMPGWLGPLTAEEWIALAHSDMPIACHMTIVEDEVYDRQCAGAAQYRRNVYKSPRDRQVAVAQERDSTQIFGTSAEFLTHHTRGAAT